MTRLAVLALSLLATANALASPPAHRVAFVSSESGSANFSTWTSAGGLTGLAAADKVCQTLAAAVPLANSGNFVAWASDSTDDAYCRVHGFGGKKSANCGQGTLPESAGPWVRADNQPFAEGPPDLLNFSLLPVYTPLIIDESGSDVGVLVYMWTGTGTDGALGGVSCDDWTSTTTPGNTRVGYASFTGFGWFSGGTSPCTRTQHLVCMETGAGAALDLPMDVEANIVFVTTENGNGELETWNAADVGTSGIEAGDSICNNLAADAGLPFQGQYKAWLSDASTDAIDRFENEGPYARLDGIEIAANKADLIDSRLFSSINQEEDGTRNNNSGVWTGTNADGTADINHNCSNWTSSSGMATGKRGRSTDVSESWTLQPGEVACDQTFLRLYCISDANLDISFEDGFEGDD